MDLPTQSFSLLDNIAIITGGGSEIGRQTAIYFLTRGAKVALIDNVEDALLDSKSLIEDEVKLFLSQGMQFVKENILTFVVDVTDENAYLEMFSKVHSIWGGIDSAVLSAGIGGYPGQFSTVTSPSFLETLRANILGVFEGMKSAAKYMKRNKNRLGGSVIVISSPSSFAYAGVGLDYSTSKAAINSMVNGMVNELRGCNIRCNAVCPPFVETPVTQYLFGMGPQMVCRTAGGLNVMKRQGKLDEIASVIGFLACD